jgi:hypothetical protein
MRISVSIMQKMMDSKTSSCSFDSLEDFTYPYYKPCPTYHRADTLDHFVTIPFIIHIVKASYFPDALTTRPWALNIFLLTDLFIFAFFLSIFWTRGNSIKIV